MVTRRLACGPARLITRLMATFCAAGLICSANAAGTQTNKSPLTVAEAIQTVRMLENGASTTDAGRYTFVSPDRRRFAVFLIRADLEKNGNWGELRVGGTSSLDAAARLKPVAKLFTRSYGEPYWYGNSALTHPAFNTLTWLDDHTVTLLWDSPAAGNTNQIAAIDVDTGQVRFLTNGRGHVTKFDVAPDGTVLFSTQASHDPARARSALQNGFVVAAPDVYNVLRGDVDGHSMFDRYWNLERHLLGRDGLARTVVTSESHTVQRATTSVVSFAPTSRVALIDWTPRHIPAEWAGYEQVVLELKLREARGDPLTPEAGARGVWQLFVLDVATARAKPLWDAPVWLGTRIAWNSEGTHAVLGPTFLPLDSASRAGRIGKAVAVVDIRSGEFQELSLPGEMGVVREVSWPEKNTIVVRTEDRELTFRGDSGRWMFCSECRGPGGSRERSAISVEAREGLNQPPVLVARDARTHRERIILDPNPGLTERVSLGRAEPLEWLDPQGRKWTGRLYLPVDAIQGKRYPLVIQTHGFPRRERFSLYGPDGPGLGPSHSVFAAQPLANRGIAVLQVEDKDEPGIVLTPEEPKAHMAGYEAAIGHLVRRGLVDERKVGLVGFSRTGWHVGYALSHSATPFAAAIISDNYDGNYVQATLSWNDENTGNIGAAPFGAGLAEWLSMSPAFNAERITAPLSLRVESAGLVGVLPQWEMFVRLRQLGKPVELRVVPRVEQGSHGLQNPQQCLAAQESAVDWFDFWLNGRVSDSLPADDAQRWRAMRESMERASAQALSAKAPQATFAN